MEIPTFIVLLIALAVGLVAYQASRRSVLDKIPGPPSKSLLLGSMPDLMLNEAGSTDFSWQEQYGDVIKFKAPLGTDRLLISDPKALQHILQTSGYRWGKSSERQEISRLVGGKGVGWADGESHNRQRKIMLPGFGAPEARNLLPVFFSCASQLARRWSDILSGADDQTHIFNFPEWISRATLDAIGQGAFDYDFGATEDHETELGKAYQGMFLKVFGRPSKVALVLLELFRFIPPSVLEFMNEHNPSSRIAHIRHVADIANGVAKQLVQDKSAALLEGKGKNDVMSLLVKANAGQNTNARLTEEEMLALLRTIIVAGHEASLFLLLSLDMSNLNPAASQHLVSIDHEFLDFHFLILRHSFLATLTWLLYELVRDPKLQNELRAEIRAAEKVAALRGDSELNIRDLEGMSLLSATIKETLRFHPVVMHINRATREDDIIPLSTPITATTGEVLTEILVPKGTGAILSVAAYNRNKTIFGDDAHTFNPYRWLEPNHVKKGGASLGPFVNLATFSAGVRVCVGWRFAVVELQAFIVELLSNFEFFKTPQIDKIRPEMAIAVVPTVEGESEKGTQLPLKVTFALVHQQALAPWVHLIIMISLTSTVLFILAISYVSYKLTRRTVLDKIPGPPSKSFLLGSMTDLMRNEAGSIDMSWTKTYGDVVKFKGPFGADRLLISDPKALQHILQTSGYRWQKSSQRRELSRIITGRGLLWADGDDHRRQRKIMLSGFTTPEANNFLPIFFSCAASLARRWSDVLTNSEDHSYIFNIPTWVTRATLDAIGKVAFDYDFGATDNHENEVGKAYQNFLFKVIGSPSKAAVVMLEFFRFVPPSIVEFFNDRNPNPRLVHARHVAKITTVVSKRLIAEKSEALAAGKGQKDIMSLLVKANTGENPKGQLSEVELLSQMRVFLLAGHETTANSLSWLLYQLVKNPKLQEELRTEILAKKKEVTDRGDSELNIHDLEGMPLLGATVREVFRFNPVITHIFRTATEDDVLPLSTPITTATGEILTELPISKGTQVLLSIPAYNRIKSIFGEDSHTFDPYRWLEPGHIKKGVSLGPFENLATFSAGIRVCIGWRLAVIELLAFVVQLLSQFEFSATPKIAKVRREPALVVLPTIEGERQKGSQLPLKVTFAASKDKELAVISGAVDN
ncbi:hypothetical protein D9757_011972 [Collybiopsis confluens]|uniref:Cytochrome P450 n=1 Tax=Collybiopsis confluens TaxID=2823264 RepID=A0A8H5LPC7_9AGAR|nr:hypothetical protein D9757_011972 [Collybiopsis confluens]